MRRKYIYICIMLLGSVSSAFAQSIDQIVTLSTEQYGTTARSAAMGGAFGALGGDISSININPAGIGVFQSNEFSFSLGLFNNIDAETKYGGEYRNANKNYINISNWGFVSTIPVERGNSSLINLNWGISFNRNADFKGVSTASLRNSKSSRTDAYAAQATAHNILLDDLRFDDEEGYNPYYNPNNPLNSNLAFQGYLIQQKTDNGGNIIDGQWSSILPQNATVDQLISKNTTGSINNYTFSFGGNVNHKLYFGASLDIKDLHYEEQKTYSEQGSDNLKRFTHTEVLNQNGTGVGINLGLIYRPTNDIRIGAAFHSPTYYSIKEDYYGVMDSRVIYENKEENVYEKSPMFRGEYKLNTPLRINTSVAFIIKKHIIASMDYEYLNYGNATFSTKNDVDNYDFTETNNDIQQFYKGVHNLRFGLEYRLRENYYFRGGYQLLGNPYEQYIEGYNTPNSDGQIASKNKHYIFSAGVGYRTQKFFVDAAFTHDYSTENYYQYIAGVDDYYTESPQTETIWKKNRFLVTVGFRF